MEETRLRRIERELLEGSQSSLLAKLIILEISKDIHVNNRENRKKDKVQTVQKLSTLIYETLLKKERVILSCPAGAWKIKSRISD